MCTPLGAGIPDGRTGGVIAGVSTFEQLESNLKDSGKGPLPADVIPALDEAWSVTKPTTPDHWYPDLKYTYDTQEALLAPKRRKVGTIGIS